MHRNNNISVIIATFNRAASLKTVLDSVLSNKGGEGFDFEVLVVDNNSTDATKSLVQEYRATYGQRVGYLFEQRQGKTFALNLGIANAKGEIIAITDDDCIVDPHWIASIHTVFNEKNVDLLGGKIVPFFPGALPRWLNPQVFKGPFVYFDLSDHYIDNTQQVIHPLGANFIMRKKAFLKYGAFEGETRGQDTYLAKKWESQGAVIGYDPCVIVHHYTHPHRLTKKYIRIWYYVCGLERGSMFREKYSQGRKVFNVSVWVYRELCAAFKKTVYAFFVRKNTLESEVWVWYYLGVISRLNGLTFNSMKFR